MIIYLILNLFLLSNPSEFEIENARELYYKATNEEKYLELAIKKFESISSKKPEMKNLSMVYIGSLITLKAKYAFWPQNKLEYANEGMDILDKWIKNNEDNIEALFIYGTTYYYMPFFFNKSEEAEKALKKIIYLASPDVKNKKLLKNALEFIKENIELSTIEKNKINKILENI